MAALPYPPVADAFLAMFDCTAAAIVWENPAQGTFGVVVPPPGVGRTSFHHRFTVPEKPLPPLRLRTSVVEIATEMRIPSIPETDRSADPPLCLHGTPTLRRAVLRRDSPNVGRSYYICGRSGPDAGAKCPLFRWSDELELYSTIRPQPPLSATEVHRATAEVDPDEQLEAWNGGAAGHRALAPVAGVSRHRLQLRERAPHQHLPTRPGRHRPTDSPA